MTSAGPPLACPKCGATTVQATPVKRSSVDKALAAEYLRAAGGRESSGDTIVQQVCQRCGTRWLPRTAQERQLRALSGQLGPEAMKSAMAEEAAKIAKAAPAAAGGTGRKWKVRPLTVVLGVIIVILLILVVLTTPQQ